MRTFVLAGVSMVTAAVLAAAPASATRGGPGMAAGAHYPAMPMGGHPSYPHYPSQPMHYPNQPMHYPNQPVHYPNQPPHYPNQPVHYPNYPRPYPGQPHNWGGSYHGRWNAGYRAPGGWNAYRHPSRGYRLPSYWISPSFFIGDFASYGLAQPPYGYSWSRYYDDAVLIDQSGSVYDSRSGIDWGDDAYAGDDGYQDESSYQGDYYQGGGSDNGYAYRQSPPPIAYPQPAPMMRYGYGGYSGAGYAPPAGSYPAGVDYASGGNRAYAHAGYGGATAVAVSNPGYETTTTTTTEEYIVENRYVAPRRRYYRPVRRAPVRHVVHCYCR